MSNVVKLVSSQKQPVHGCGTCRFVVKYPSSMPSLWGCGAVGLYAANARRGECNNGQLWEPQLPHIISIRLLGWLVRRLKS